MFGNARFVTGRFCYREASELGENLLYNMQKPHIIITKYANKDLRDENNYVVI